MTNLVQTLADIHCKNSKKIRYTLLKVSEYRKTFNKTENPECGICYKNINKKVFVCANPCDKTFHQACLETMIDHLEDNADNEDKEEVCYQCCYCRREFDINQYELELFVQKLLHFQTRGYNIGDAVQTATLNAVTYEDDYNTEYQYDIYFPVDPSFVKKPKQSKRADFKNHNKNKNQYKNKKMRMNIGQKGLGRR